MGDFSISAWGFRFCIIHIVGGVILFIICLIPTDCYAPLERGTMGMVFSGAILSIIANGVWAGLQTNPTCRWSGLEYVSDAKTYEEGNEIVTIQGRCYMPKFPITIFFTVFFFIGAIVAAAYTNHHMCSNNPAPAYIIGSIGAFIAVFVYLAETVVIFKWPSKYDSGI